MGGFDYDAAAGFNAPGDGLFLDLTSVQNWDCVVQPSPSGGDPRYELRGAGATSPELHPAIVVALVPAAVAPEVLPEVAAEQQHARLWNTRRRIDALKRSLSSLEKHLEEWHGEVERGEAVGFERETRRLTTQLEPMKATIDALEKRSISFALGIAAESKEAASRVGRPVNAQRNKAIKLLAGVRAPATGKCPTHERMAQFFVALGVIEEGEHAVQVVREALRPVRRSS